ncbi:hypothetical protein ACFLIM_37020 [Nonomuraea sp. M3C6]|uniref:Alpha/beta hydrolase n=1 Tax=Nonomuraea marmarensis TaxID=3351344 RepID=A0ABW7AN41_9ACTN
MWIPRPCRRATGRKRCETSRTNNPWSETKVDSTSADRGALLIISREKDHTVPWAIANASYKKQVRNEHAVTEIVELPNRGHSLTIDSRWREVAGTALAFVERFR